MMYELILRTNTIGISLVLLTYADIFAPMWKLSPIDLTYNFAANSHAGNGENLVT